MFNRMKRFSAALLVLLLLAAFPGAALAAPEKLERGDSGAAVENLQTLLKKHNCYNYPDFTGYFGSVTETAVRNFQSKAGLKADGIAGPDTMKELQKSPSAKAKGESVAKGMSGKEVEAIQKKLKDLGLYTEASITGYYGPKTEAAVTLFQQTNGLTADGIAGKKTKEELFSSYRTSSLVPGTRSDDVLDLQTRLKKLGYYDGPLTGLYGQTTQKAVEYFQKLNQLSVDGIAGKATRARVMAGQAKSAQQAKREGQKAPAKAQVKSTAAAAKNGKAIVDYAKQFIGVPYRYGASGPSAFDCSGLTSYVYKQFGVSLPRSSKDQGYQNYGIKITDKSQLKPGDLLFFNHSNGVIGHVGIYVGDGKYLHAPYTGAKVRIDTLKRSIAFARRVFT